MNQELKNSILKKLNEDESNEQIIDSSAGASSLPPSTVINPQLVGIFVEREVNKLLKQNCGKLIPEYLHSANQKLRSNNTPKNNKNRGNNNTSSEEDPNNSAEIKAHISKDNTNDLSEINSYDFIFEIKNGDDKKDWVYIYIDAKASRQNNVIFQKNQIDIIKEADKKGLLNNKYFYILYFNWNYTTPESSSKENDSKTNTTQKKEINLEWNPGKGVASCKFNINEICLINIKKLVQTNSGAVKPRGRISYIDKDGKPKKAEYAVSKRDLLKYKISNPEELDINSKMPDEEEAAVKNMIQGILDVANDYIKKKTVTLNITEESLKSLNESYGSNLSLGYGNNYSSSANQPYFKYEILPLNNNLGQKGYTLYSKTDLQTFDIIPGHYVSGISPIDEKKHYGTILRFFKPENQMEWEWVFILDKNTNEVIALYPDTIKKEFRTGNKKKES